MNEYHPTQMIADLLTMKEFLGNLENVKCTYMGNANSNVGNSLLIACSKMGIDLTICSPQKYFPNILLVNKCKEYAKETDYEQCERKSDIYALLTVVS